MSHTPIPVEDDALIWAVRSRDPSFEDWGALTAWLEADAAHAGAYARAVEADSAMDAVFTQLAQRKPAPSEGALPPSRRRWTGRRIGGFAAATAGAVALSMVVMQPAAYSVETAPGQRRTIALEDGTRIDINGGTRITLYRGDTRRAVLDRGEALFSINGPSDEPFEVKVGGVTVEDDGTVFNILRTGTTTEIGVSEGAIVFDVGNRAIRVREGSGLRATDGTARVDLVQLAPDAVAGWRVDRLSYRDVTLARIAEDIGRNLGVAVSVTPEAGAQRFTGTLTLDRNLPAFFSRTAPVLGVAATRTDKGWMLKGNDAPDQ